MDGSAPAATPIGAAAATTASATAATSGDDEERHKPYNELTKDHFQRTLVNEEAGDEESEEE